MPTAHLTDLTIKSLPLPAQGQLTYTDDTLPGFGLRISQGGVKSFVLVHGRSRTRTTLGRYPIVSLQQARTKAKELLAERTLGKQDTPNISFETALTEFFEAHISTKRPKTALEIKRLLNKHFLPPLRHERLHEITTHRLSKIVDSLLSTPSEASHAFAAARLFLRWAVRRRLLLKSPLDGAQSPALGVPRARVLTADELAKVFLAARAEPSAFSSIVQLLILLGQRCGETARLRSEMIDLKTRMITLPASLTKNRREHRFPFGKMAERILKSGAKEGLLFSARGQPEEVFSGWSKCKVALDERCGIEPWTLHDLRRTFATNLAALGTPIQVTEKLLNHVSGTTGGIVAVYQRHSYEPEMRAAITRWERHLSRLLKRAA